MLAIVKICKCILLVEANSRHHHCITIQVKNIRKGINPPSASLIYFTGPYLATGFKIGIVAGMIGLTEAIAIGRTFAALKDYQIDGNKEMMALGTMNIVGSLTSCYVATGTN